MNDETVSKFQTMIDQNPANGLARFSLAKALVLSGGDRSRALAEAGKAADGYRTLGEGMAKEIAEVEAFISKHGGR